MILVSVFAFLVSFAGVCIRAYTIGTTLTGHQEEIGQAGSETLNTKGIYSMVRHPLYLGIILCGQEYCYTHLICRYSSLFL
jgi:protein-S-isoprenylcysteine O-methyltransferase Ste14